MIAACPRCSARYRIEKGRLRPEGARLRCSRCEAVFRVRPPEVGPVPEPQPLPPAPEPPEPPGVGALDAVAAAVESAPDRARLVLVADPVIEEGKATAGALATWGLQPILVHDGVEAILTVQRTLPRVVIIDAALPKMYGFQVCELLKRNESLRHIHVVLVGAIHDRNRYRRPPTELYGADAYLERPQLPDALWPILHGFRMPLARAPSPPAPLPAPSVPVVAISPPVPAAPPPPPVSTTPAPEPDTAADAVLGSEVANAERLARIVVSDIILYNQERFDAAIRADNVLAAMDSDLAEGRALFAQRIDARVRETRDFLTEELLRVAGSRRSE